MCATLPFGVIVSWPRSYLQGAGTAPPHSMLAAEDLPGMYFPSDFKFHLGATVCDSLLKTEGKPVQNISEFVLH